uniref:Uncharacterized protein n=1 Tax=Anopheles farauti TaxID=69004 RepID=A0A182QVE0_9DIPT
MRLLGVLYLFFLVQGDVGTYGEVVEPGANGSAPYLTRRKRGWSWSSSATKKVTKRPIGWSVGSRPSSQKAVQKPYPTQQSHYVPPQPNHYVPTQQIYYPQVQQPYPVSYTRPTKSLTSQLVKAAVAVGVAGAVSAYAKPVRPSTKSPAQREEERERRRQQRLSRRSRTTTEIAPTTVEAGNSTLTTTPAPLANSELIPVVVPDANNLLQIVYVRRDQIPPGGMPIAVPMPLLSVPTTTVPSATTQQATPAVPKA